MAAVAEFTATPDAIAYVNEALREKDRFSRVMRATVLCAAVAFFVSPGLSVILFVAGLIWGLVEREDQRKKRTAHVTYPTGVSHSPPFTRLSAALPTLCHTHAAWQLVYRTHTPDQRRNAGAVELMSRLPVRVGTVRPPYLTVNISVYGLWDANVGVYFLPDALLIWHAGSYTLAGYDGVRIAAQPTRFIESGVVPVDAVRVDTAWRYVNKDGSPDRRFNNNYQIPVMVYAELQIVYGPFASLQFHISNAAAAEQFSRAAMAALGPHGWSGSGADREQQRDDQGQGRGQQEREQGSGRRANEGREKTGGGQQQKQRPNVNPLARDYATLGLAPQATREEVTRGYRQQAQLYHPDKVAQLGPELKEVADRKMKEINEAYQRIKDALDAQDRSRP